MIEPVEAQRVFVTGGHGFIGTHLVAALRAHGYPVLAPARAELDLRDGDATRAALARYRPTVVLHLASAAIATPGSEDVAMIAAEVAMTDVLATATPPCARFIQAGSMAEYGARRGSDEAPGSVYGRAKLAATRHLHETARARGIAATVVRIFGAYGAGEGPRRLFPTVLAAAHTTGPIALSDGLQRRDLIHVGDVVAATVALLGVTEWAGHYDIGTGETVLLRDAVARVAGELGIARDRLHFGSIARRVTDVPYIAAETDTLERAIGWVPRQHFASAAPILPLLTGGPAAGLDAQQCAREQNG